ncbi:MAG: hypothetical protein EOP83_02625 [Verrucomicrobiaceae bacterium]|nr:MAG: hypothetical protein EOP83_02625 [Verrucomicrobiaceae bacterium]
MGAVREDTWMNGGIGDDPHRTLILHRTITQDEIILIDDWIKKEPGLTGRYWRSTKHWSRGERAAIFCFEDKNTAIAFKLRWA